VDPAFQVHMLTEGGKARANALAQSFDILLAEVRKMVPEGRELSLVKTKLEEACFFAKKGMAQDEMNHVA
jgi:hypothetical protein